MRALIVLIAIFALACLVPTALGQFVPLPEFDTPAGFLCGDMSTEAGASGVPVDGVVHVGLRLVDPGESFGPLVEADLERLSLGCTQIVFEAASPIDLGSGREAVVFHATAPETVGIASVAYFMKDGHLARVAKRTASEPFHWRSYRNFRKLVVDFAAEPATRSSASPRTEI